MNANMDVNVTKHEKTWMEFSLPRHNSEDSGYVSNLAVILKHWLGEMVSYCVKEETSEGGN